MVCALQYRTPYGTNLLQPFLLQYFINAIFPPPHTHKNKAVFSLPEFAAFLNLNFVIVKIIT
jgi:hypothetical protein